jgi:hypothetical protein
MQPRGSNGDESRHDRDRGWGWTRKAVADVVAIGLRTEGIEPPFDYRDQVWSVIKRLLDDPEPTPAYEERFGGSNMDPSTLSINTVRGQAMHALIFYALWVGRHLPPDTGGAQGFDRMEEVQQALDEHLDRRRDPSVAVRSVYGQWLPWIIHADESWTIAHLPEIFPSADDAASEWEAAWGAYITYCAPYDRPFELLQAEYRRAIDRLGQSDPSQRRPMGSESRLADHLMTLYWRGKLDLAPDGLLAKFFDKADDQMRAWALAFVGRSLQEFVPNDPGKSQPVEVPPEVIVRLQKLWEARLATARAGAAAQHIKELSEFGWWFGSRAFDPRWALEQLIAAVRLVDRIDAQHLILNTFEQTAPVEPRLTAEALRLLVGTDREGWGLLVWEDRLGGILESLLASPDDTARQVATDTVHQLGARGYRNYRRLLKG